MRNFNELSKHEQVRAFEKSYQNLIAQIAEGVIIIDGIFGKKVNSAIKRTSNSKEPGAVYRAIADAIGNDLKPLVKGATEDAKYDEEGNVIYEIAQ